MAMISKTQDRALLMIGLALLSGGSFVAAVSFGWVSIAEMQTFNFALAIGSIAIVFQAGGQATLAWWAALPMPDPCKNQDASIRRRLFDRHLVVLGSFLYVTAVAAALAFVVTFFHNPKALEPFKAAATLPVVQAAPGDVGAIFAMSVALSVIGALFF